jgi:hypothetical protein
VSEAKKFELQFDKREVYTHVRIRAERINKVTVLDYLSAIAVTTAQWHTRALLIERDVPMALSDEDMLASWGVFMNTRTKMRVALLNPHPHLEQYLRRIVSTAKAGSVNAAYFDDLAEAERWVAE